MKTENNKTRRIEIRLSEEDFKLLRIASFTMGLTNSRLIRMLIDGAISGLKLQLQNGGLNIEDYKELFND